MQNEITAAIGIADYLLDFMFDSAVTSDLDLPTELAQVQVILRRAEKCQILQDAEPGWNEKVHCRVLELALGEQGSVDFQNMYAFILTSHTLFKICQVLYHLRYMLANLMNKQYNGKDLSCGFQA